MSALTTTSTASIAPSPRLRLASDHLSCTTASSLEAVERLRPEWDSLAERVGAPVYQTYDWVQQWWAHYGGRRDARVLAFRDDEALVGVVPMCIDRARLGPVGVRVAKIMGSDFTQAVCNPAVEPSWAPAIFDELLRRLVADDGCDAVHLGPLADRPAGAEAVRTGAAARADLVTVARDRVVGRQTILDLPDSYDGYLGSLSRNQRSNLRRAWSRLQTRARVDTEIVTDPAEVVEEFGAFARMHRTQWQRRGRLGHFGDWPEAERFNHGLVTALGRTGRVRFMRLRADERVIARQYGFVFGDTCHCRLAARSTEAGWEPYGLGRLSLARLFERLIDEGVRRIDAGIGHYDYKLRLGGREEDVRSLLLVANRDGAAQRVRSFCWLADRLDRLYYRLWFCRLAPRLPGRGRPLARAWIRSRI